MKRTHTFRWSPGLVNHLVTALTGQWWRELTSTPWPGGTLAWAELHIELDFFSREQLRQKEDKRGRTREYQIVNHYSGKWLPLSQASVLVDFVNLEILVNCHMSCLWLTKLETFFYMVFVPGLWGLHASSLYWRAKNTTSGNDKSPTPSVLENFVFTMLVNNKLLLLLLSTGRGSEWPGGRSTGCTGTRCRRRGRWALTSRCVWSSCWCSCCSWWQREPSGLHSTFLFFTHPWLNAASNARVVPTKMCCWSSWPLRLLSGLPSFTCLTFFFDSTRHFRLGRGKTVARRPVKQLKRKAGRRRRRNEGRSETHLPPTSCSTIPIPAWSQNWASSWSQSDGNRPMCSKRIVIKSIA